MLHFTEKYVQPITDKVIDKWMGDKPNQFAKVIAPHLLVSALATCAAAALVSCSVPLGVLIPAAIIGTVALGVFCHVYTLAKRVKKDQEINEIINPIEKDARMAQLFVMMLKESDPKGYGMLFTGTFIECAPEAPKNYATIIQDKENLNGSGFAGEVDDPEQVCEHHPNDPVIVPGWAFLDENEEAEKQQGSTRRLVVPTTSDPFNDPSFKKAMSVFDTDPFFIDPGAWFAQKRAEMIGKKFPGE